MIYMHGKYEEIENWVSVKPGSHMDNGWELDRKLKTMLRTGKDAPNGWSTWLRSAIAEIKQ